MKVSMPTGSSHGWGIAGNYLAAEIAKLPPVEGVTLHAIAGHDFAPCSEADWNRINIGYCFFEHEILAYHHIPRAEKQWDFIVAGSRWCECHLRIAGMQRTATILQGVDSVLFPCQPPRIDDGRFIVFSGGKFEFRKGQDLVIAAMRTFMARHSDVWLSSAWHNHWPNSVRTMEQTSLIDFTYRELQGQELFRETIARNGIDADRVILHPPTDNIRMAPLYSDSNIGLFPNRCEGGNNMVMCEYMACGRPVIASPMTGHADVVSPENAVCLTSCKPVMAQIGGRESGVWFEPSVEEIIDLLEEAYCNRDKIQSLGLKASGHMARLSWAGAARQFHEIAVRLASAKGADRITLQTSPEEQMDLADSLFRSGRYVEAETYFRELLRKFPFSAHLHNSIATALDRQERYAEAVAHYNKALALQPDYLVARFNLGNTLKRKGDCTAAIDNLKAVVESDPLFIEAWQNLALCRFDSQDPEGAAKDLEQMLKIDSTQLGSRVDLGNIFLEIGRYQEALECFESALLVHPDDAVVLNSKGIALQELDDFEGAEACFRRVLALEPRNCQALNNLGTVYRSMGKPQQAIECFNRALELEPDNGQLLFNRSLDLLTIGDYSRGWADYEMRFAKDPPVALRHTGVSRWQGGHLNGERLLVQAEQGYGDTLQFVRYLPLLANFGGPVVFECQDHNIKPVLESLQGVEAVIARGEATPPFAYQVPLLSLPGLMGTTLDNIPFPTGYLNPDPAKRADWKEIFSSCHDEFMVGIAWSGQKPRLNANRSMRPADIIPLLKVPGIRFFSLQLGTNPSQMAAFGNLFTDLSGQIRDFGDTAAIVANLDLVITIDTALAHLAGALGTPTWVMLKDAPDWRWFPERSESPWYASMKLFRQKRPGSWAELVMEVAASLKIYRNLKK
jgi:tetratricopeptide (TPR) repeat protein